MHATSLAAVALFGITFLPAQAPPVAPQSLEDLLPVSTYATMRFGGLAACREAANELPLAAVVQAFLQRIPPEVRATRVEAHLDEAAGEVRAALQQMGITPSDLRAVMARPMVLAIGRISIEGMGPSVALLVDEGVDGQQIQRFFDTLAQLLPAIDARAKVVPATIAGVNVRHVQSGELPSVFAGSVGGAFVVTNSRGYLRELADVAAGKQPGLGRATRLAALQRQLPAPALASCFVNAASVCAVVAPHLPYEADDFAQALGLGQVDAVYAATTAAAAGGTDLLHVGVGGSEKGMMKVLVAAPVDWSFANACSSNTVLCGAVSFDVRGAIAAFERFTTLLPREVGEELRRELAQGLDEELHFGNGPATTPRTVLDAFGTQVAFAFSLEKGAVPKPELLVRVAVRDATAVGAMLQRLEAAVAEGAGLEWKTRKAGEHEVRFCSVPLEAARLQLSPSYLLQKDALWLASDAAALVRALRQGDDAESSLTAQADFKQMIADTKGACGVLHLRSFRAVEIGWRTVETMGYPQLDAHKDEIGFGSEALPDAETMAKALGTSTFSYHVDGAGVTWRSHGTFTFGALLAALGAGGDDMLGRAGGKVY